MFHACWGTVLILKIFKWAATRDDCFHQLRIFKKCLRSKRDLWDKHEEQKNELDVIANRDSNHDTGTCHGWTHWWCSSTVMFGQTETWGFLLKDSTCWCIELIIKKVLQKIWPLDLVNAIVRSARKRHQIQDGGACKFQSTTNVRAVTCVMFTVSPEVYDRVSCLERKLKLFRVFLSQEDLHILC